MLQLRINLNSLGLEKKQLQEVSRRHADNVDWSRSCSLGHHWMYDRKLNINTRESKLEWIWNKV